MNLKRLILIALLAAALPVAAQTWPSQPIRIIRSPDLRDLRDLREHLVAQGAEVHTMAAAEFTAIFERERKHSAAVVAQGGVKLD